MLLVAPVLGAGFWFLTAPDLRFVGATIWLLFASTTWLIVQRARWTTASTRALLVMWLALAFWPLLTSAVRIPWTLSRPSPLPTPTLTPFTTDHGLVVGVPGDGKCWEAAPPCTLSPRADLQLRTPGNLRDGFLGTPWRGVAPLQAATDVPDLR